MQVFDKFCFYQFTSDFEIISPLLQNKKFYSIFNVYMYVWLFTIHFHLIYFIYFFSRKRRKVAKAKMFSFHKPKVYRSTTGCCICRAKSSSSRFTDSKKYEEDFLKCFQLLEPRSGEICNACVLLVKRFKKLPPGSNRNWNHVSFFTNSILWKFD